MGHEFAGRVVEAGPEVEGIAVGDRLTAMPITPCGACARCAEGRHNLCGPAWASAIAFGRPGAFAQRLRIAGAVVGENVFLLDDAIGDAAGAMVEPLAVAVHAVRLTPGVEGAAVLVTGLGTIGQCVVRVLRARGAGRVFVADLSAVRLRAAIEAGAEALDVQAPTDGEVDLAFECSGAEAPAMAALRAVRPGGTVTFVAHTEQPVPLDTTALVQRELRLQGSYTYTSEDFAAAVELLRTGAVGVDELITEQRPLTEIAEAFRAQLDRERAIKVLVTPQLDLGEPSAPSPRGALRARRRTDR
jgi:2-desacetyl-2-hydroxyethyl bacteriochlorophyllide A dehydrogenase